MCGIHLRVDIIVVCLKVNHWGRFLRLRCASINLVLPVGARNTVMPGLFRLHSSGLDVAKGGPRALSVLHTNCHTLTGDDLQVFGPDKLGGVGQLPPDPCDMDTYHVWDGCTISGSSSVEKLLLLDMHE